MVRRMVIVLVLIAMMAASGCMGGRTDQEPGQHSSRGALSTVSEGGGEGTPSPAGAWGMEQVWHVSTGGIPFMDLAPNGSLAAVIDFEGATLYLVHPDGMSVSFDLQETDPVEPVVAGVAIKGSVAYVLGSYAEFAGVRLYSWRGQVGEQRHGWTGSVADNIMRSPSGNHLCYLVTVSPTEQELYCDGIKTALGSNEYEIHSVSDTGVVVLGIDDSSVIFREGKKVLELNTPNVVAYRDKLLASEDGKLRIYSLDGKVLSEKEGYTFKMTTLMRWTLIPTGRYIFRYEPLEDTSVLTWNLTEVRTLPGFPYFANENFVVTGKDGVLHCYSLKDFHEVFSLKFPGDSIGYVRLSEDGRVMLVSDEYGGFWLYRAG